MKGRKRNESTGLRIDTGENRQPRKKDGPLFYILPPLIVAAVFYYCATTPPPVQSKEPVGDSTAHQMTTEKSVPAGGDTEGDFTGEEK